MSELLTLWNTHANNSAPAILAGGREFSYANIHTRSVAIARGLLAGRDSLAAERIGLFMEPGAEFVASLFGILLASGVVIVLSPLHAADERAYVREDARVTRVLTSNALLCDVPSGGIVSETLVSVAGQLPVVKSDAPALQLYTSGTTAKPKGAVLTHQNLAVQQRLLRVAWGFSTADVLLHSLPLHHMHGLVIALFTAIGAGSATRMISKFQATEVWEEMGQSTVFMGVPTMYARLFQAWDAAPEGTRSGWARSAKNLRLATSGSAALPVTFAERWRLLTGNIPLERFGMTEVGVGTTNPLEGERRAGTVGEPLPSVEVRIVGDDGQDAEVGELWLAGPSVFAGYFERAEATRDAFVNDGSRVWFRSGDTVTRDEKGYVRILGRTSVDIIKSGGYKLSALEIEEVFREHPDVVEVAVIGWPNEMYGEVVVACLVTRNDCETETLRAFANERLANYKVPRRFEFFPDLPKNVMGKVQKPQLRKILQERP